MITTIVDGIGPRLEILAGSAVIQAQAAMEIGAMEVEAAARANAPWDDRTGDARAGLTAETYEDGGVLVIELYHTVDYGQWLELIQDGRFATIMPTLEAFGPEILRRGGAAAIGIGMEE
jgi:hypothetical protein